MIYNCTEPWQQGNYFVLFNEEVKIVDGDITHAFVLR